MELLYLFRRAFPPFSIRSFPFTLYQSFSFLMPSCFPNQSKASFLFSLSFKTPFEVYMNLHLGHSLSGYAKDRSSLKELNFSIIFPPPLLTKSTYLTLNQSSSSSTETCGASHSRHDLQLFLLDQKPRGTFSFDTRANSGNVAKR